MTLKRTLGVCYYPEHWPEEIWTQDAACMLDLGLTWVRIGEFAWSRLEPSPGCAWHADSNAAALDAGPSPRHACRGR